MDCVQNNIRVKGTLGPAAARGFHCILFTQTQSLVDTRVHWQLKYLRNAKLHKNFAQYVLPQHYAFLAPRTRLQCKENNDFDINTQETHNFKHYSVTQQIQTCKKTTHHTTHHISMTSS